MAKVVYQCPACMVKVTTYIKLVSTPICENHEAHHHKRQITMKEIA